MISHFPAATRLTLMAAVLAATALAGTANAASDEEKYRYATSDPSVAAWQIDFQFQKPAPIAVRNADGAVEWYWYLPYKVVNNTGARRLFVPSVAVADDNGRVIQAGQDVPDKVYDKVQQRLSDPLLKSPIQVKGPLLEGQDHAEESVFIWKAFERNEKIDRFRIFVAGLSGKTTMIQNPRTGEPVQLQHTLMLEYRAPGAPASPADQPLEFLKQDWVMR
jgi:hypothetical protein